VALPTSKLSCASPLQTISRSVTMPISRSFSPIGMAPMSCSRINFASSVTGVSGLTQSTPLWITSLTFMTDLRCWNFVHWVKSNPGPLDASHYTTDRGLLSRRSWGGRRNKNAGTGEFKNDKDIADLWTYLKQFGSDGAKKRSLSAVAFDWSRMVPIYRLLLLMCLH